MKGGAFCSAFSSLIPGRRKSLLFDKNYWVGTAATPEGNRSSKNGNKN